MAHGKRAAEWKHTSSLMALLANCHSAKRKFIPAEFDPTVEKPKPIMLDKKQSVDALLKAFIPNG